MNFDLRLILASKSPRRQQILKDAGFTYEIGTINVEETYPSTLPVEEVARYLAIKKAKAYQTLSPQELLITADTVVKLNGKVLGKPSDASEAKSMLHSLSGNMNEVITGVCIRSTEKMVDFEDITKVYFAQLTAEEIDYYVENFIPLDKAGAYGIQEWIGMIGIEKIEGSYFNVVGLPIQKLYRHLTAFDKK